MFRDYAKKHPGEAEGRIGSIPRGRLAKPEDIAKAAVFLASFESVYLAGVSLCVDGSALALLPGYTTLSAKATAHHKHRALASSKGKLRG